MKTIKTSLRPEDSRQQLLNEIIGAGGKTLRSVPKPIEKVIPIQTSRVTQEPLTSQEQNEASRVMFSTTFKQNHSVVKPSEPSNGIFSSFASFTSKNTSSVAKQDPSFLLDETKMPHKHNNGIISENSISSLTKSTVIPVVENLSCSAASQNQPPTPVTAGNMPTREQGSDDVIDGDGEVQSKNDDRVTKRMFLKNWDPVRMYQQHTQFVLNPLTK